MQAIFSLEGEGEVVISARLAQRMRVTSPTAWATVRRMARDGLVELDARKVVHLTAAGRQMAESIVRRHRLAERFLTDVLDLRWAEAHEEAHLFEHGISPLVEERIIAFLGNPQTCPHGSPIPGSGATLASDLVPLSSLAAGDEAIVGFISEELEEDSELLHYLERGGIKPGHRVTVREILLANGMITVQSGDQQVPLGTAVARRIRVRAYAEAASPGKQPT